MIPSDGTPLLIHAEPDLRILLFTLGLTFLTGIIFGLLPALRASRPDPWTTLKDAVGSIAGSGGSLFLRKGLGDGAGGAQLPAAVRRRPVRAQPAESEDHRHRLPRLDNLVTFQLSPALNGYDAARTVHFYDELLDAICAPCQA